MVIEVEYDDRLDADKLKQALDRKVDRAIDFGEMLDLKVDNGIYACEQYSMDVSRVTEEAAKVAFFSEEDTALAAAVDLLREAADACAAADPEAKNAILSLAHDLAASVVEGKAVDALQDRPQEVIVCYDNETWDTHVVRAVSGQAAVDLVYDQIHNGEWSRNPAPVHVGIHREDLEEDEDEDE
jgi:hypothetical protein